MSKTLPTDRSLLTLPDLDQIAIQTQLVVRQSKKFSPDAFLCSLLEAVSSGKGSSNQIASHLGDRLDLSMARQSMHDRFSERSTAFFVAVHTTCQDRSIGKEALTKLRPGDLVQRDMGFFILGEFSYIEEQGAFWQSRLPLNVEVTLEDGRSLEKHLRCAKGKVVDLPVLAGKAEQKNCRLVAVRAHPKITRERRKQRRQQAKSKGKTPS